MPSLKPVISLRLDPDIDAVIRRGAAQARLPVSAYVQFVLARALEANGLLVSTAPSPPSGSTHSEVLPPRQGRNELCACRSGRKFKLCCGRR